MKPLKLAAFPLLLIAACESAPPSTSGRTITPPPPQINLPPPPTPPVGDVDVYSFHTVDGTSAATIHEPGWRTPIRLNLNDQGWEDSPYLTRDGKTLLFFWHPSDRLADPAEAERVHEYVIMNQQAALANGMDGKTYVSVAPFQTKTVHDISRGKRFPSADSCPYIAEDGDVYHCSTLEAFERGYGVPSKGYRNKVRIDLGTRAEEVNHHYCAANDELWFDCPGDQNICLLRNAKAGGFMGATERAPAPINLNSRTNDFQPFLTDDCQTLYFTSDRAGRLAIYKSQRNGFDWSTPETFVSHAAGVAELSMTADGDKIAFSQLFWRADGSPGTDIWYAEKEE